jgi:hypothetical protein
MLLFLRESYNLRVSARGSSSKGVLTGICEVGNWEVANCDRDRGWSDARDCPPTGSCVLILVFYEQEELMESVCAPTEGNLAVTVNIHL